MHRRVEGQLAHLDSINARRSPREWDSLRRRAVASLESAGVRVTSSGDTLTRLAYNDSQSVTLVSRADTIRRIDLSPAAERGVGRTMRSVASGLKFSFSLAELALVLVAVYLAIPLALGVVTLLWWYQRSRRSPRLPAAT
jgi:hypothetical protein